MPKLDIDAIPPAAGSVSEPRATISRPPMSMARSVRAPSIV